MKKYKEDCISSLKKIEVEPATPEKKDRRLFFMKFLPKFLAEKAMRNSLPKLRAGVKLSVKTAKRDVEIFERKINGYNGEIKIRIYTPIEPKGKLPLTMFFHGGAFIGGNINVTDDYCCAYADITEEKVISVEYSLAPEYAYPHGLEDCYLATKWAAENADVLNIDAQKLTVSGDSAGGNFAAVITLLSNERKDFNITGTILIYPYTSFATAKLSITKVMQKWYVNGNERGHPYISPIEGCIDKFPPTITITGEYDMLRESGYNFAEKLALAGVDSTYVLFKKSNHAFIDQIGKLKQGEELLKIIKEWKSAF